MKTKLFLSALVALSLSTSAHAWGGLGHQYVARLAIADLPDGPLKAMLAKNTDWLASTSSHPDRWRNRPDNAEPPRHFLDGERFGFGTQLAKIPQSFTEVQKIRNYDQLRTDGMNPWTVDRVYKLLVSALKEKRWDDAMVQAAYLSHYVADAHVPFHASENYDGNLSTPPQKGIHSRFEEKALERSIAFKDLAITTPISITAPISQMFTTLQASINAVAPILAADRAAQDTTKSNESEAYWTAFLKTARPIAIKRLETGGQTLAGFYLKAWNDAGRPALPSDFVMTDRLLPYAAPFVPRGAPSLPAQPVVTESEKAERRRTALTLQLTSEALGGRLVPCTVLLPKDYYQTTKKYPVLYLLHGAWGKHTDWNGNAGVAAYVKDLPLIVVMPDSQGNAWYQNSPGMGNWQTYFESELMPTVEAYFRTINTREGRAIAGLSMGGYGSWKLGLDNNKKFCAAASLSGALFWGEGKADGGLADMAKSLFPTETQSAYNTGALWPRIEKLTKNGKWTGPALYFDCGKDDFLIQSNRSFERRLLETGVPFEFAEFNGAHTWPYWDEHVRDVLNFVLRHITAPTEK